MSGKPVKVIIAEALTDAISAPCCAVCCVEPRLGTRSLEQGASLGLTRACQAGTLAASAASFAILLGSADFRTRWEFPPSDGRAGTYAFDHFLSWAAGAALLGGIALLSLLIILQRLYDERFVLERSWQRSAAILAVVAAGCCLGAAAIARWYWQSLLFMPQDPDAQMFIAGGLAIVTVSGTAGGLLAFVLAGLLLLRRALLDP